MRISISFLKSNYDLKETINRINQINDDSIIHVDVLDGEYVDASKTDLDSYIDALKSATKPLDVHLMVNHPISYIKRFLELNPVNVTVHHDCLDDINEIYNLLKDNNIKMGIALNPNDDVYVIKNYINILDLVLVMSVFPGKGGQKFIASTPYKLEHLIRLKKELNKDYLLEVDGGVNDKTIKEVNNLVDLAVSGSYICCSDDYQRQIDKIKDIH